MTNAIIFTITTIIALLVVIAAIIAMAHHATLAGTIFGAAIVLLVVGSIYGLVLDQLGFNIEG